MFRDPLSALEKLQDVCTSIPSFKKTGDEFFYKILNPSVDLTEKAQKTKYELKTILYSVMSFISKKETKNNVFDLIRRISQKLENLVLLEETTFLKTIDLLNLNNFSINIKDKESIKNTILCFDMVKNNKKDELSKIEKEFKKENNTLKTEFDGFIRSIKHLRKEIEQSMLSEPICKGVESVTEDETTFASGQMLQQEVVQSLSNDMEKISHDASVEKGGSPSHKKNPEQKEEKKEEKKERKRKRKKYTEPPLTKKDEKVKKPEEIEKNITVLQQRTGKLMEEKERIPQELHKIVSNPKGLSRDEILRIKKLETVLHLETNNADKIIQDVQKIENGKHINYNQCQAIENILKKITKFLDKRDALKNDYEQEGEQIEKVSLDNPELSEKWEALGAAIQKDLFDAPRKSARHMGSTKKIYESPEKNFQKK